MDDEDWYPGWRKIWYGTDAEEETETVE